jgi:hypothetical protein
MFAEVAHVEVIQTLSQEISYTIASAFPEFESFNLLEAPWIQIKKFILTSGFLDDYTEMVSELFTSGAYKNMPAGFVLEKVAILTCLRIFNCPVDDVECLLQSIFNELLFLRVSVRGIPETTTAAATNIPTEQRVINQVALFSHPWHPIIPSIRLLLE